MLVVSVTLIVIALLVLRFTVRFSIEEEFREIGVMQAIGLKGISIRRLYLIKYFAIALVGAGLGTVCALPFATLLTADLTKLIVLREGSEIVVICICAAVVVVGSVMLSCWLTTGRIRKMTAIQIIREGSSGERFRRRGIIRLRGHERVSVPLFMAVNDIFASLRSYVVIFLALTAGLQLVLLPFNARTTYKDGSITKYFVSSPADYYADFPGTVTEALTIDRNIDKIVDIIKDMEREYALQGVNVNVSIGLRFSAQVYTSDPYDRIGIQASNETNYKAIDVNYLKGRPPQPTNEIAMTNISMEKLGVVLGDSVHMAFGGDDREYIITASFESLTNTGLAIIFAPGIYPDMLYSGAGTISFVQFTFNSREDIQGQIDALKAAKPELSYHTPEDAVYQSLRATIDGVSQMVDTLTVISLAIIALVTFLICNTLIARDKSIIALLKSIGFSKRSIRVWQTARVVIVALAADIAGVALSFAINPTVTRMTFGTMGVLNVRVIIDPARVFGLYPALFLMITASVAVIAARSANRVDMRSVGNLE
jgi:putative ABC transport system permease protein